MNNYTPSSELHRLAEESVRNEARLESYLNKHKAEYMTVSASYKEIDIMWKDVFKADKPSYLSHEEALRSVFFQQGEPWIHQRLYEIRRGESNE